MRLRTVLKVGFTYNIEKPRTAEDPFDLNAEFDSPRTLLGIKKALVAEGHEVICIEANESIYQKLLKFKDEIDIIFNIAEGFSGDSRESIFPIFFEFLNLPYTGSGPETLSITLNKHAVKKIWKLKGIPTPSFQTIFNLEGLENFSLEFPVIVKPVHEGTSKGIHNDSYIDNYEDLEKKVAYLLNEYNQEVIIEEFIDGREFTVSILGNEPNIVFPPSEIDFSHLPDHLLHFCSYEAKTDYDHPEATICPAHLSETEENQLKKIGLAAYKSVNCRDFGRCDMRMDYKGNIYVLEINPLPGISSDPEVNHSFPKAGAVYGYNYTTLINQILNNALERYNLL